MVKEAKVGIFWVLPGSKLLIHALPWTAALASKEGSRSGNWINYAGHADYWEKYSLTAKLRDAEYTDYPRGRVIFNVVTKKTRLFLGSKIAKNKALVKKIARAFNLDNYNVVLDRHYEDPSIVEAEME